MPNMKNVLDNVNNAFEDIEVVRLYIVQNRENYEDMYELLDTAKDAIEDAMNELESELPDTI